MCDTRINNVISARAISRKLRLEQVKTVISHGKVNTTHNFTWTIIFTYIDLRLHGNVHLHGNLFTHMDVLLTDIPATMSSNGCGVQSCTGSLNPVVAILKEGI